MRQFRWVCLLCLALGGVSLLVGCGGESTPPGTLPSVKEAPPMTPEQKAGWEKHYSVKKKSR
jgi:hypothetical protein